MGAFLADHSHNSAPNAMFTLNRIALAPARKLHWIGLPFTYRNGDFGAISV